MSEIHSGGMPNFADDVARKACSHDVMGAGFWPGNRDAPTPNFYAYAYPTPDGYWDASVSTDVAAADLLAGTGLPSSTRDRAAPIGGTPAVSTELGRALRPPGLGTIRGRARRYPLARRSSAGTRRSRRIT